MIIGLCGEIGVGKSTVAEILANEHGFVKLAFADKLKDTVAFLFDLPRDLLEGNTEEGRLWREQPLFGRTWKGGKPFVTPRELLQTVGHSLRTGQPQFWLQFVRDQIVPGRDYVISDIRYENEWGVATVAASKFQSPRNLVLVKKPFDVDDPNRFAFDHDSEKEWRNFKPDYILLNNRTKADLAAQVTHMLTIF